MIVEIKVPQVGESISDGILAEWKKNDGDFIEASEELFELETDKVTMPVGCAYSGKLSILIAAGETVTVGQVVATVDTSVESQRKTGEAKLPSSPKPEAIAINAPAGIPQVKEKLKDIAPSVRRLVAENQLDPSKISGSGKDGRITKGDVLLQLEGEQAQKTSLSKNTQAPREEKKQTREPMSKLRQRIAERLVQVQQNAAILTTFNEADMTAVIKLREKYKEEYQKKYGIKLGFMSFFVKAVVEALKAVPRVNAQIDGNDIVYNHYYDIGVAVSTAKGLVVPVVRNADKRSFSELELEIYECAKKARERTLTLDDLLGGVFTISNGGVFGSLLSTPILNPPQSGILGMHAIKNRPVAASGKIEIRPMMYLALSYDHRLVDGAQAVVFLCKIVDCIEHPVRIMLEI